MAQRVDKIPERRQAHPSRGRPRAYPWDEWLDGSVWRLVQGKDFAKSMPGIRSSACKAAAARGGLRVITRTTADEPGVLYIQAVPR